MVTYSQWCKTSKNICYTWNHYPRKFAPFSSFLFELKERNHVLFSLWVYRCWRFQLLLPLWTREVAPCLSDTAFPKHLELYLDEEIWYQNGKGQLTLSTARLVIGALLTQQNGGHKCKSNNLPHSQAPQVPLRHRYRCWCCGLGPLCLHLYWWDENIIFLRRARRHLKRFLQSKI